MSDTKPWQGKTVLDFESAALKVLAYPLYEIGDEQVAIMGNTASYVSEDHTQRAGRGPQFEAEPGAPYFDDEDKKCVTR